MCMGILTARMSVYHVHVVPEEAEEGIRPSGTEVTDSHVGVVNPSGPLEEQQ